MGFCEVLRMFVTCKKCKTKRTDRVLKFHIDYEGVEKWMNGEWQTKKDYIKKIRDECVEMLDYIPYNVIIEHVPGHATPEMRRKNPHLLHIYEGNDNADRLAKSKETINTFPDLVQLLN